MKYILSLTIFLFLANSSIAQVDTASVFDFWVGNWELTWKHNDGSNGSGTNLIEKTLDGKVIQENFEAKEGNFAGFKGTSLSVYNPNRKTWHQAWADNQGGYFNFVGEFDAERRIFRTEPRKRGDNIIIQRMVFYNISENAITWDWETSNDNGESWKLNWKINYRKVE